MSKRYHADYHIHTNHSPDAYSDMVEACHMARSKGFNEIAFTDHFEFYSPSYPKGFYSERYLREIQTEIRHCQELFQDRLVIRQGIEMGQPTVNPEWSKQIMDSFHFDYVVGAVHKLRDLDISLIAFKECHLEDICQRYLCALYDLVESADFDCLAHIDLIRRYSAKQGIPIDLCDYPDQLEAVLKKLIERGKGLEINTSGLRQEAASTLPGRRLLRLYKKLGGEIIVIGSDAHQVSDVGADWGEAADIALQTGFKYYATYEGRKPIFHKLEG